MPSLFASPSEQNLLRPPSIASSSNHASSRHNQPQPSQQPFQPSPLTSSPPEMLKPSRKKYLDITLGMTILAHLLETTLHAVVAIFGIGVGVGLILGDTFRSNIPAVTLTVDGNSRSSNDIAAAMARNSNSSTVETSTFSTSNNLPPQ